MEEKAKPLWKGCGQGGVCDATRAGLSRPMMHPTLTCAAPQARMQEQEQELPLQSLPLVLYPCVYMYVCGACVCFAHVWVYLSVWVYVCAGVAWREDTGSEVRLCREHHTCDDVNQ